MDHADIERRFTFHPAKDDQPVRYESLRSHAKDLAFVIDGYVPDSPEKSLAVRKLEEAVFWANAGISRNE